MLTWAPDFTMRARSASAQALVLMSWTSGPSKPSRSRISRMPLPPVCSVIGSLRPRAACQSRCSAAMVTAPHAAIGILGRVMLAEREPGRKVALLRSFPHQAAQRAVPQVIMRVDQPGQRDHRAPVERERPGRGNVGPDRDDVAVAHVDIAAR